MKILLIEDEAGLQRLISDSLTREHFVVECVSTCQAAL